MDFYWKKEWTVPAVGAASFIAGAALGTLYTRNKYKVAIDDISEVALKAMADLEVAQTDRSDLSDRCLSLGTQLDEAEGVIAELRKEDLESDISIANDDKVPDLRGIDVQSDEVAYTWTPEDDVEDRTTDGPYILHQDEFGQNQKDYRQVQLRWYDVDKILSDENGVPIYGPEKVVGQLIWGRGSDDEDVIYIRNDANKAEYEVHRVHSSYMADVVGLEAEEQAEADDIRHSQRVPRFRNSD